MSVIAELLYRRSSEGLKDLEISKFLGIPKSTFHYYFNDESISTVCNACRKSFLWAKSNRPDLAERIEKRERMSETSLIFGDKHGQNTEE